MKEIKNYLSYARTHEMEEQIGDRIRQIEAFDDETSSKLGGYILQVFNDAAACDDSEPLQIAEHLFTAIVGMSLKTIVQDCAEKEEE